MIPAPLTALLAAEGGRRLGGIIVGIGAILVGAAWLGSAIITRRHRADFATTYRQSGGVVYTVAQVGCAAGMAIAGVVILAIVLLSSR